MIAAGNLVELESGVRLVVLKVEKDLATLAYISPSDHVCNVALNELKFFKDVHEVHIGHLRVIKESVYEKI